MRALWHIVKVMACVTVIVVGSYLEHVGIVLLGWSLIVGGCILTIKLMSEDNPQGTRPHIH